ncbi:hypothetical protein [Spirosoma jeollabukense]
MTIPISIDADHHLTDVFDVTVYILLCTKAELAYLRDSESIRPMAPDFPQFSALACRMETDVDRHFGGKKGE